MRSIAATLPVRPIRDPKRRHSFYGSLILCSVLRHGSVPDTPSPELRQQRLDALFEAYAPSRRTKVLTVEDVDETAELFRHWGFRYDEFYRCVRAYPRLLGLGSAKVAALFEELAVLGFSPKHIRAMMRRYPELPKVHPAKLQPMQQYFLNTLQLEEPQFVQLMTLWPGTLTLHLEENVIPTCEYLMQELSLETAQIGKMVTRFPQILTCSLKGKLKPIVQYFLSEIGVSRDAFAKKIKHQPSVLGRSPEKIKERVQWLETELGYTPSDVRHLCSLSLHVFQQGLPKLEAKIDNLCSHFGLDRHQCGTLIKHYPQILTISIQNVNETMAYLTEVMQRDLEDILNCPTILWCSLTKRLRPRHERLMSHQFPQSDYALGTLYGCTDAAFERILTRKLNKMAS